jgi:hypothetical protein
MIFPTPFPAARYRLRCTAQTPLRLPDYAGSTLRGAFGHALRRLACMTRQPDCKACPLHATCPYPAIFSPPPPPQHHLQRFSEIPVPFIVEPPAWGARGLAPGDTFDFGLVLMGPALNQLPLILHAWQRALDHGIGKGQGQARLEQVDWMDGDTAHPIHTAQNPHIMPHAAVLPLPPEPVPPRITLRHSTPLRLQHNGRPIDPKVLQPVEFLMPLIRRIALLSEFHLKHPIQADFAQLKAQAQTLMAEKNLHWQDWQRYSSRQQQNMALGGCMGNWQLIGDLTPFWPWLWLGQWLHAGKNASFGLGQYRLQTIAPDIPGKAGNPRHNIMNVKEKVNTAIQHMP